MKILNISIVAVALVAAGASTAFARGGVHTESPLSGGSVNSYAALQPVASAPTETTGVVVRQYPGLNEQSAAVLRLEEIGDANSEK